MSINGQTTTPLATQHAAQLETSCRHYRQRLQQQPQDTEALNMLGLALLQQGQLDEAQSSIEAAIAINPAEPEFHNNLGNVLTEKQRYGEAVGAYVRAVGLDQQRGISNPVILGNLGNALNLMGRKDEAVAVTEEACRLDPDNPVLMAGYALALKNLKRYEEALTLYIRLVERDPHSPSVRTNLANTLTDLGYYAEALQQFAIVLEAHPDYMDARYGQGVTLWQAGELTAAFLQFQECLDHSAHYADAHRAMTTVLETATDFKHALASLQQALAEYPQAQQLHSVLAYSTDFDPALRAAEQQQVRKAWYAQQIAPQQTKPLALKVTRDPERTLRVGFIPGRFYRNASIYAYLPVLLQLDPARFEIYCYDSFYHADEFTHQIQARAKGWCDISRMSDAEVAQRVCDDRIDILIDLFAHAGANRLPIYAWKPAPLIVTAWGHANGTGMPEVDYLFSDPVSIPPEETPLYAEHVHYLPCQLSFWLPENAPPVSPLPQQQNGYVTFGCFNRMVKVSDAVLALWAQLLAQVPNSRLVLKAGELEDAAQRQRVENVFAQHGVAASRLSLYGATPWFEHLARYAEVDVALDPFPMGGGVTTLDTLWMGVPVVCLRGQTLGQRITSAIMTAIGLEGWVCNTPEAYIALAKQKAANVSALAHLRRHLRARMAASPLGSSEYYVGCVADALSAFWRQWCADPASRLPQPSEARFAVGTHAAEADQLWRDFLSQPDSTEVRRRLAATMRRAGKPLLAAEFEAGSLNY